MNITKPLLKEKSDIKKLISLMRLYNIDIMKLVLLNRYHKSAYIYSTTK